MKKIQRPHTPGRMLALALFFLLIPTACKKRPDGRILNEFRARFKVETPGWKTVSCAGRAGHLAKLSGYLPLLRKVMQKIIRFDTPAPAVLHKEIMNRELLPLAGSFRCVVNDLAHIDLRKEPNFMVGIGSVANLYFLKGEALLKAGKIHSGFTHLATGLSIYRNLNAFNFIHHLGLQYFLKRLNKTLSTHTAPPGFLERFYQELKQGILSREAFCGGLRQEFLGQAAIIFRKHLGPLKELFRERFGTDWLWMVKKIHAPIRSGDHDRWKAFRALFDQHFSWCTSRPMKTLTVQAGRASRRLKKKSVKLAWVLKFGIQRLKHFSDLQDTLLAMFIELKARPQLSSLAPNKPIDLARLKKQAVVPLKGAWAHSEAKLYMKGSTLVIERGAFKRVLKKK